MKSIWKFQLALTDSQSVAMPIGTEILSAQLQNSIICLWAIVDDENGMEYRDILIQGTGEPLMPHSRFIGTVQRHSFVWHVFEGDQPNDKENICLK